MVLLGDKGPSFTWSASEAVASASPEALWQQVAGLNAQFLSPSPDSIFDTMNSGFANNWYPHPDQDPAHLFEPLNSPNHGGRGQGQGQNVGRTDGSVQFVNSNTSLPSTLQTFDTNSFSIRVDTIFIGSLTSAVSGFVRLGLHYDYDQDAGVITVKSMDALDIWSNPTTIEYYRKAKFVNNYADTSPIWNQFNTTIVIEELV